jgi:hypothetical protein
MSIRRAVLLSRTRRRRGSGRQEIDARGLDDGLPRGFLVGAIVKVWLAHHLNGPVNFPAAEAKNWPETSVPNADAWWYRRAAVSGL